ncbi:MAG: gliding motility lipoprotein GldH [Bacteroidia bacterium]|nr:gliding motility lipoprotein GldH [Bacteroidia bacterium]
MLTKAFKTFCFCLLLSVVISCDSKRYFEENKEIPGTVWNRNNIISFTVPVTDTHSINNVYVNIRHNGLYEKSNMYLFINIIAPNGNKLRDTVNCLLADDKGKWLGSGLGDIYSNQLLYKKDITFPTSGNYTFEIEQAMRMDNLKNVEDIGIRIEKVK